MHLLVGRYLEAGPAGLRWRAAQLIGTCSQNVAAIQEQVLGLGALRKLLRLLDRDPCDSVRVKALFAISCECPGAGLAGWGLGPQGRRQPSDLLQGRGRGASFVVYSQHLSGLCLVLGTELCACHPLHWSESQILATQDKGPLECFWAPSGLSAKVLLPSGT